MDSLSGGIVYAMPATVGANGEKSEKGAKDKIRVHVGFNLTTLEHWATQPGFAR